MADEEKGGGHRPVQEVEPEEALSFKPWEKHDESKTYVSELPKNVAKKYGMLYCGGSHGMIDILKDLSLDYGIDLHIDSFGW